ncbi:DUF222 domain-containing protein [Pseudarthrobacter phenanthrenivorans]|uniref:HNH endonuclease signature motif containing protein n=1 Tax=Pseudarthrobacter phenanthrenivorans TaxID=361575 RepID=UPI001126912C|nr:HNH endonuclease signature motif containing protein [Pseudarthrobacter phenanthrenivorans]TPV48818.1 DUF222 domain-containing protein [Pseudarthrobacter phenanthrenivorans]
MEAIGDQFGEYGTDTAVLTRPASRGDNSPGDRPAPGGLDGCSPCQPGRHIAVGEDAPSPSPTTAFRPEDTASHSTAAAISDLPLQTDTGGAPRGCISLGVISSLLASAAAAAPAALAAADYVEASYFAGKAEELARSVEYLQLLAAGTVDRTRAEAIAAADAARVSRARTRNVWVTGWESAVETLNETDADWPGPLAEAAPTAETSIAISSGEGTPTAGATPGGAGTPAAARTNPAITSPADDGCRNTAEFLRLRLRIPLREARRRLALAHQVLSCTSLTGQPIPPARPHLAAGLTPASSETGKDAASDAAPDTGADTSTSVGDGIGESVLAPAVSSYAGTIITAVLDRLHHRTTTEVLDRIEQDLTKAAAAADPDFVARLAQRWTNTVDADGTEPSEEALRHTQGAFIRKPRHGLHHLEIFATTDQYEHLLTVMNAATNPRTGAQAAGGAAVSAGTGETGGSGALPALGNSSGETGAGSGNNLDLERRTRSQKQLDGIIGAVKAGMATNKLPCAGGNRPQIMAIINQEDLFPQIAHPARASTGSTGPDSSPSTSPTTRTDAGSGATASQAIGGETASQATGEQTATHPGTTASTGTGNFVFTGPVAAATLRKLACDAEIIPAVLGSDGEILDLGRKTRLFTPAQRLALTARDQGCSFPNCTIPAPWCEAHHITYWSHGGPTTTSNGALLCTHHHHLVHKEQWTISVHNAIPWYTPPQHIDPHRKPQQNHYFKPPSAATVIAAA